MDDRSNNTLEPKMLIDALRNMGQASEIDALDEIQAGKLLNRLLPSSICRRLGIYELPDDFMLSVVIPVFNEERTLREIVARVRNCGVPCEVILVNDGSTDGTQAVIDSLVAQQSEIASFTHDTNQGKGAAIRTGFKHVRGEVVIIQDADLEYDPLDYGQLLRPIIEDQADVVYGSRFSSNDRPVGRYWHQTGNRMITLLSNVFTNLKLSDVETCFKMIKRSRLDQIADSLREKGFGIEVELTSKLARLDGIRFYEVPVSYFPRSFAEGKKIKITDAFRAVFCIIRYQLVRR